MKKIIFMTFLACPSLLLADGSFYFPGITVTNQHITVSTNPTHVLPDQVTYMIWYRPTTGTSGVLINKGLAGGVVSRTELLQQNPGNLRWRRDRSTTMTYTTNSVPINLGHWLFVMATFNANSTPPGRIYTGSASTPLAESTYGTATAGSGAGIDNSKYQIRIGNAEVMNAPLSESYVGMVGIWEKELTLAEGRAQQFNPHITTGCVFMMIPAYSAWTSSHIVPVDLVSGTTFTYADVVGSTEFSPPIHSFGSPQ